MAGLSELAVIKISLLRMHQCHQALMKLILSIIGIFK